MSGCSVTYNLKGKGQLNPGQGLSLGEQVNARVCRAGKALWPHRRIKLSKNCGCQRGGAITA